ncbi:MAG: hypothetical protein RQM90_04585 [Methanoculleus sp.]
MKFRDIINDFLNRLPGRDKEVDAPEADTFEDQDQEIFDKIEDQRKLTGKGFTGSSGTRSG